MRGGKLVFELRRINQIIHAQADARRLVAVSRADAALGGADFVFALEHFARAVQFAVIRKNDVRRFAQHEILRRDLDAEFSSALPFPDQADGINHHAVADDAEFVFAQNAGRHEVQDVFLFAVDRPCGRRCCRRRSGRRRPPDSVSTSMILPLPSSPHWAPTRIVFAINYLIFCGGASSAALPATIKIPGRKSGAKRRGLCAKKLKRPRAHVNSAKLGDALFCRWNLTLNSRVLVAAHFS